MRQAMLGGILAITIIGSWLALHVYSVFFHHLAGSDIFLAPLLIAGICWLNVGLFIVAHDAMHGSLFPHMPRLNLLAGRVALGLYAGFGFDRLKRLHMAHHEAPGSLDDPDFDADHPSRFWPWYLTFMRRYFGLKELLVLCVPVGAYLLIGARLSNLLLLWALPAILSSVQLFYFGTYLPHRHGDAAFADRHNARTSEFDWLASLITCFHFGYHHEHHLRPSVPWWGLPRARLTRRIVRRGRQQA